MSLAKSLLRALAAVGPFVGLQARLGGMIAAMTSEAVFSRGRVTASAATRATRSLVSV
jgi:hypothetical protein